MTIAYYNINHYTATSITEATSDKRTPDLEMHVNFFDITQSCSEKRLQKPTSLIAVILQDDVPVLALLDPEDTGASSGRFVYERLLVVSNTDANFKEALSDITIKLDQAATDMLKNQFVEMTSLADDEPLPICIAAGARRTEVKKALREFGYEREKKSPYWRKPDSNVDFKFV